MSSDLAPPATTRFAPPPSSRTSRPMTRRIFINRRRSLLARRGPGPTGPRAAGQAPSGGIETAVAAFGRRWAKIGGRAPRPSWVPPLLGECFLALAARLGAQAVKRTSVLSGKSVSVRVDVGVARHIQKKQKIQHNPLQPTQ